MLRTPTEIFEQWKNPGCSGCIKGGLYYPFIWGLYWTIFRIPIKQAVSWKVRGFFLVAHFPFLLREFLTQPNTTTGSLHQPHWSSQCNGGMLEKLSTIFDRCAIFEICSQDFQSNESTQIKWVNSKSVPSLKPPIRRTQTPWVWSYLDPRIFYLSRYDRKTRETFEKLSRQPAIESHGCPGTEVRIKGLGSVGDFTPNITPFYT